MPLFPVTPYGHPMSTSSGGTATRSPFSVATLTALKALVASDVARTHGNEVFVDADQSRWCFHSSSAVTGDDLLVATPAAGTGRWLRVPGACVLVLPIAFGTADAAVLYTMPTGARLRLIDVYWHVLTDWTGGSSSAIGVSSAKTGFSTKGDLVGGAAGDVAATLVASVGSVPGTIGVGINSVAKIKTALWLPTDTVRFDRITSAFTAGTGNVRVVGLLEVNAGA
jgi:hypothetical protein